MSHISLGSFYRLMFALTRMHNYRINEIEDMYPFERDIYVDLISDYKEREGQ